MGLPSQILPLSGGVSFRRRYFLRVLFLLLFLGGSPVSGNSPGIPGEQDYYSADGRLVFGVMPKSERSDICAGELFALRDGRLRLVWHSPLLNRFRPADVLVANDGTVVTLDNWESMGTGDTVVVVYAPDGSKRFGLGLEQILSEQEVRETVPATISSRWWRNVNQKARIDEAGGSAIIPTTAGWRAVSLQTGAVKEVEDAGPDRGAHAGRKEETLDSGWRYEAVGRLECLADCDNRDNWFIHLRPGKRYPQRLRLTVQDVKAAKNARERNVRAIVHVDRSGGVSGVRAFADSLTVQRSVSMKELFETPLRKGDRRGPYTQN